MRINGASAGSFDVLRATGGVEMLGLDLKGSVGFAPASGQTFPIIDNRSGTNTIGHFTGGNRVHIGTQEFAVNYAGGDFNDVVLTAINIRTRTWTGLGADNNWTTAANWDGDTAPAPWDNLVFAGTNRLTPPTTSRRTPPSAA